MLVFVDESGDTGLKLKKNSSRYFVVSAVLFRDREEATRCDRAIQRLADRAGRTREYHFVETTRPIRINFFTSVRNFDFIYAAVVINKAKLHGPGFRHKGSFLKCTMRYAFSHLGELQDATVVVDRTGDRDFRRTLKLYLKREVKRRDGVSPIRKVRTESSHSNRLIQLADMVCGAVARSYGNRKDASLYREMILPKERRVQVWPS